MNIKQLLFCLPLAGLLLPASGLAAVKIGQSCALTGSADTLGKDLVKGVKAYFDKHAAGEITLAIKDDGYEPERSIANTQVFLKDGVQALFSYLGTPSSKAALPLANESKMLFFAPGSGAGFLSDAEKNPYSFALRPTYDAELENMVQRLKEDLGVKKITLFVQRDAFGLAGITGAAAAVKKLGGIQIIPEVPPVPAEDATQEVWNEFWSKVPNYKRNSVSVGEGMRQVRGYMPDAVILMATARPAALAINEWHKMGFKVPMLNISFVGADALAERLKETENVYCSQAVPDPWNASLSIVKQYQEDMGGTGLDFVSLEGYLAAQVFHQAVKSVQGEVTSETLKTALEAMNDYDAGGIKVSFGPQDHRGLDAVYLSKIEKTGKDIKFFYIDKLPKPEDKSAKPEENAAKTEAPPPATPQAEPAPKQ